MDQNRVDMFIASMGSKLPPEKTMILRDQLAGLDDSRLPVLQSISYQDPTTLLLVSIFVGGLGIDRFMLGETGLGIAKLLTCGGLGIWTIVDWFTVSARTREQNYQKLMQVAY